MIEGVLSDIINFMTTTKKCSQCGEVKLLKLFSHSKGVPRSWCKSCVNRKSKDYYRKKNPEAKDMSIYSLKYGKRDDPDYNRKYKLLKIYNLTEEYIETIIKYQNGNCALCCTKFVDLEFSVDHDHNCCSGAESCGVCIRGFLCMSCNTGLGKLKDDITILRRAIDYLENNPFYDRRRS